MTMLIGFRLPLSRLTGELYEVPTTSSADITIIFHYIVSHACYQDDDNEGQGGLWTS